MCAFIFMIEQGKFNTLGIILITFFVNMLTINMGINLSRTHILSPQINTQYFTECVLIHGCKQFLTNVFSKNYSAQIF